MISFAKNILKRIRGITIIDNFTTPLLNSDIALSYSLTWLDFENKDNLMLTGFLKAAIIGVIPTVLFLIIVFYLLNKQTRLSLSLIIGICFLGTFAFLQYKLLKTF